MLGTMFVMGAHASQTEGLVMIGAVLLGIALLLKLMFGKRSDDSAEFIMQDEVEEAMKVLAQPRRGPGGVWVRFKVTMVECENPNAMSSEVRIGDGMARRAR